jgi:hypothetical protein
MIRRVGHPGSAKIREAGKQLRRKSGYAIAFQRYNIAMPASGPKRQPDPHPPDHPSSEHHRTPQIYTLEATGLLVIAALILILTLVRYWHHIPWSAR